jgi:hypothetical protein
MRFHFHVFAEFFAAAVFLLAVFGVVGAPVKLLLHATGTTIGRAVSAPVIGLAMIVFASWYWATPHGGLKPVPRILFVIGALTIAGAVAHFLFVKHGSVREFVADRRRRDTLLLAAICFFGLAATTVVNDAGLFEVKSPTVLSLGNNDAASYALLGQHALDEGPRDPGAIVGFDTGVRQLGFSNGAYDVLAASGSVTGEDVWKVMQPTLFVVFVLGAFAMALLLRELFEETNLVVIGLSCVTGFSVLYVMYLSAQWFFAQMIGIALVMSVTAIVFRAARASAWRDRIGAAALIALLLAAGLAVYPHMVIMGSVALLPVSAVAHDSVRSFVRRALYTAGIFGAGALLAAAIAPGLVQDAIDITRELEGVEAGWSLPSIYPTEMFGYQTDVYAPQAWPTVLMSALLLLAFVGACVLLWRRGYGQRALPALVAGAVVIVSYTIIFHKEGGPTYRQWKWATFFIPLFVAVVLVTLVVAIMSTTRWPDITRRVGYGALLTHMVVVISFASGVGFPLRANGYLSVSLDEADLQHNPALKNIPALHVNTSPYWETMWIAYFLRNHELSLAPETYYPPATVPISHYYIERNDTPAAPGAIITKLNETYRLSQMP